MSCFWDGIIAALEIADFKPLGMKSKPTPQELVMILQSNNVWTTSVLLNQESLPIRRLEENLQAIEGYDPSTIKNGYECSVEEPFLFLVSEFFRVSIKHKYLNTTNEYSNIHCPERVLYFSSNKGHFQTTGKF